MKAKGVEFVEPIIRVRSGILWLHYPCFANKGSFHGIAVLRRDSGVESEPLTKHGRFELIADMIGVETSTRDCDLVVPHQTHGSHVIFLDKKPDRRVECDALITSNAGLALGVTVADCIPLLAYDHIAGVVGVAHCGWRGVAAGIVAEFGQGLTAAGSTIENVRFLLCAGIGQCCYEVGDDLLGAFETREVSDNCKTSNGKTYFDIKSTIAGRILRMGADASKISIDRTCTACQKFILSSYRAMGARAGHMIALIMLVRTGD